MTPLAPVFALLARLILKEVDETLLRVLRQVNILEVLEKAEPGCAAYLAGSDWQSETFDVSAVDFTGLFIVPQGVQPQASAWLPGERELVGGHVATLVHQTVETLGLQPADPDLSRLPADHLALLLSITAQALSSEAPQAQHLGQTFFEQTLAPWLPTIGARIGACAHTPLYRAVGALLAQLPVLDH